MIYISYNNIYYIIIDVIILYNTSIQFLDLSSKILVWKRSSQTIDLLKVTKRLIIGYM